MDTKIISIFDKQIKLYTKHLSYDDSKILDKILAKKILLRFKEVAEKIGLDYLIFYGTLLGAYRENDFIAHDTDIDVVIFDEKQFISSFSNFEEVGFKLIRYEKHASLRSYTTLYSIQDFESEIYIDLYVAYLEKNNKYNILGAYVPKKLLNKRIDYLFLDTYFKIPRNTEKILITLYGKDWNTPIKNKPGDFVQHTSIKTKLRRIIKRFLCFTHKGTSKNFNF